MLQEELCSVVEASGASLKGRHDPAAYRASCAAVKPQESVWRYQIGRHGENGSRKPWFGEKALHYLLGACSCLNSRQQGWLKCNGAAFLLKNTRNTGKAYPTNKCLIYAVNLFVAGMMGVVRMRGEQYYQLRAMPYVISMVIQDCKHRKLFNMGISRLVGGSGALNPSTNNSYFLLSQVW